VCRETRVQINWYISGFQKLMEIGTIIGDKAYSVQYITDAPRYADYLSTAQFGKSLGTDIGSIPDNSTNLHPDNLEKCHNGLCYVMWTSHTNSTI
jgi:hypothetical protein